MRAAQGSLDHSREQLLEALAEGLVDLSLGDAERGTEFYRSKASMVASAHALASAIRAYACLGAGGDAMQHLRPVLDGLERIEQADQQPGHVAYLDKGAVAELAEELFGQVIVLQGAGQ